MCAVIALMSLGVTGCGPQPEDFTGTYQGKLERTETRDELTFMQEYEPYSVYIAPGDTQEIVIQLRDECAVMAQMEKDGAFKIVGQPCRQELDSTALDAVVNGDGTVSEEGSLTMSFSLSGTGRLNTDMFTYSSDESFTGVVQ